MSGKYDDMLDLPHPDIPNHPRMPISSRAAIFSPFAALTGHGAAITETARQTQRRIELSEDNRQLLDLKQRLLEAIQAERPEITVTWFQPDARKDGGSYVVTTGFMKKLDPVERVMRMEDGTVIPMDNIFDLDYEQFSKFYL